MKKVIFASAVFAAIHFPFPALAQDSSRQLIKTNIEKISLKTGAIIKKEFFNYNTIKGLRIDLVRLTDIEKDLITSGLRFEATIGSGIYSSPSYYTAFVDKEELDGLVKFFDFISSLSEVPQTYTEYKYATKGDFYAFAYIEPKDSKEWTYGLNLTYSSKSSVWLKKKDLPQFVDAIKRIRVDLNK